MSTVSAATKLYVNKIVLADTRTMAQVALANPWKMHGVIAGVTGVGATDDGRTMYRLEADLKSQPYLLVQSHEPFDFSKLVEAGFAASIRTKSYVPAEIPKGAVLEFRVFVAATTSSDGGRSRLVDPSMVKLELASMNIAVDAGSVDKAWTKHDRSGVKIGMNIRLKGGEVMRIGRQAPRDERAIDDESFDEWLKSKLVGATVGNMLVVRSDNVEMTRFTDSSNDGQRIGWRGRLVIGSLKIDDPDAFAKTISLGIGSGRGFGFGLVSLSRGSK